MSNPYSESMPKWLNESHELPHDSTNKSAPWSENYLSYVWSPSTSIGVYVHLCHRPGTPTIWDEKLQVALPNDMYLVSKGMSPGWVDDGPVVSGIHFRCEEPFKRWVKRFQGGCRLLTGDEMRSGPLKDGEHIPVEIELVFEAMSPPFDLGSGELDQSWAVGHFEQHHKVSGWIIYNGERHEINGTGLRDHSWGERHYEDIGATIWLHGQFPDSGRSIMALLVTGTPPKKAFAYACLTDKNSVTSVVTSQLPTATSLADTEAPYAFTITEPNGNVSTIKAKILNPLRAALVGDAEIALGTYRYPEANHHYIDAFTRYDWDGEIGFGITERTVDLKP